MPGRALASLTITLALATSCTSTYSDTRVTILEEQTKALLTSETAVALHDQFGVTIDPAKARLVVGAEVERWLREHNRLVRMIPDPYRTAIDRGKQAALIVDDALPTKSGGRQSVMYLRSPRPDMRRWLVLSQPDPCGDGNPATCERCTGCAGEAAPGGILHTCVCTLSCDDCVPCRPC